MAALILPNPAFFGSPALPASAQSPSTCTDTQPRRPGAETRRHAVISLFNRARGACAAIVADADDARRNIWEMKGYYYGDMCRGPSKANGSGAGGLGGGKDARAWWKFAGVDVAIGVM